MQSVIARTKSDLQQYRRWSVHFNNYMNLPGRNILETGKYNFQSLPMYSYMAGFEYIIKYKKDWNLFAGMKINFAPNLGYKLFLPERELYQFKSDLDSDISKAKSRTPFLYLPIGVNYKFNNNEKMSFILKTGGAISISSAQFEHNTSVTPQIPGGYGYSVFYLESTNNAWRMLIPSVFVSAGVILPTKIAEFSLTLNINKSIVPLMKGSYRIYNLQESPETKGTYKLNDDFIGLDLGIRLNKRR